MKCIKESLVYYVHIFVRMEIIKMILDKINEPKDLKNLSDKEMENLSSEIRELIIKKVNEIGGHMGPNLGIVEATIALHRVFNSPVDKIVFDVSHQCYPHKILTGRKKGFIDPAEYYTYTGYTAPEESEHDIFKIGHTSTSISLAVGLAKARDLKNEKGNIIALIGDGSLSGGEAFEGLDCAADLNSNIIIIVNDNDMSIAENSGGLYKNLKLLRETKGESELNFFKALGFDYLYVDKGNCIEKLIEAFKKVKDINHPTIVHINTLKGCGLKEAEENKETFHWIVPHTLDNFYNSPTVEKENYTNITTDYILREAKKDSAIVAITPATPGVSGFNKKFRETLKNQYVDTGITEQHAVAFASGLAKNGAKPILAVMSSFIQRAYDQLSQDLCLNNSPATILVYWGGLTNADATHLTCFDIPLMMNIPNLVYLAPTNKEEYLAMLDWSVKQNKYSTAIRVPNIDVISSGIEDKTNYSILNKYKIEQKGSEIAILGLGNFLPLAKKTAQKIKEIFNITSTVINPRFITGLDEELLEELKKEHKIIITLEDGVLSGGFGEKIASFYGSSNVKVLNYGGKKEFYDRVPLDEIYKVCRLKENLIIEDINKVFNLVKL